jgi:TPR repeat protein
MRLDVNARILVAIFLFSVTTTPLPGQQVINCPNGTKRLRIDLNQLSLKYQAGAFETTLHGLLGLGAKISVNSRTLQEATSATQQWNQLLQGLAAGYNSCAISDEQLADGVKHIYPRLQSDIAEMEDLRQAILRGEQVNSSQLQKSLDRYFEHLQRFARDSNSKLIDDIKKMLEQTKNDVIDAANKNTEAIERKLDALNPERIDQATASKLNADAEGYYNGTTSGKRDYPKAFSLYKRAAEGGNADATYSLGWMYEHGQATLKDVPKAIELYGRAAAQDQDDALYRLGQMYRSANGVKKDCDQAVQYLTKASDKGNTRATVDLADMNDKGECVSTNPVAADQLLRQAANQGSVHAMLKLAARSKTSQESADWYAKAAHEGSGKAMYELGMLYFYGLLGAVDFAKARELLLQAAAKGYDPAQVQLQAMPQKLYYAGPLFGYKDLIDGRWRSTNADYVLITDIGIRVIRRRSEIELYYAGAIGNAAALGFSCSELLYVRPHTPDNELELGFKDGLRAYFQTSASESNTLQSALLQFCPSLHVK